MSTITKNYPKNQGTVKTQTYVQYQYPGLVIQEVSSKKIEARDPEKVAAKMPEGAIGFRFFDQTKIEVDKEALTGEPKNYSGWYYVDGKEMTLDEVKREMPERKILIRNMESNSYDRIVYIRDQALPLRKDDKVI